MENSWTLEVMRVMQVSPLVSAAPILNGSLSVRRIQRTEPFWVMMKFVTGILASSPATSTELIAPFVPVDAPSLYLVHEPSLSCPP